MGMAQEVVCSRLGADWIDLIKIADAAIIGLSMSLSVNV